jgi:4-amino-4-deoxychorismate lyase
MSGSGRLRDDRGLHYGDGLFETIRFSGAEAPLWEWHMQRLLLGCERLRLPAPDIAALGRRARRMAGTHAQAVVKLIYSAGGGPRGYARPQPPHPRVLILVSGYMPPAARALQVRWCQTRLALQPALAAIKHLNRLEQVLARSEWCDVDIDEGLMQDIDGNVIAATAANLFVRQDGRWLTPPIDRCGIAGVARRWLIDRVGAREHLLTVAMVESAEVGVLTNALHGPRQIGALAERHWAADREVRALGRAWRAMFAVAAEAG